MKMLEQWIAQSRSLARRARARLPGEAASLRPVRLTLRVNDEGAPPSWVRASGEPLALAQWRALLVGFVEWLGPVRVTLTGWNMAEAPHPYELVRFANRLECPTHLISADEGWDPEHSDSLMGRGLAAFTLILNPEQIDRDEASLRAFQDARRDWQRPLPIYAAIPAALAGDRARRLAERARGFGVDGVLVSWAPGEASREQALAALEDVGYRPPAPAWARRSHPLPGGPRAELLSDGTLLLSPLGPVIGRVDPADPAAAWGLAGAALAAASEMENPWDEIERVPPFLLSRR